MNAHNDIEQLINAAVVAEDAMYDAARCYLEAEESELEWLGDKHETAVYAHHEADGMLGAALDEVFAIEFAQPEPDMSGPVLADRYLCAPKADFAWNYMRAASDRVLELCAAPVAPVTRRPWCGHTHDLINKKRVSEALGCSVDKLCRTRDGSWTMR